MCVETSGVLVWFGLFQLLGVVWAVAHAALNLGSSLVEFRSSVEMEGYSVANLLTGHLDLPTVQQKLVCHQQDVSAQVLQTLGKKLLTLQEVEEHGWALEDDHGHMTVPLVWLLYPPLKTELVVKPGQEQNGAEDWNELLYQLCFELGSPELVEPYQ
jgi:hypothetical protein